MQEYLIKLNDLYTKGEIDIDTEVFKDDNLDKRIHNLENARVKGSVYIDSQNEIVLSCEFKGTMYIDDSVTLESVPYDFCLSISENLEDIKENYYKCFKTRKNTLDLIGILWQNIVLEVPISYTCVKDATQKGNGWELIDEEAKGEDPRLHKLKELLKGDD